MEKIIHQIWVGDKRIPRHVKDHMARVKEGHKDFTYHLWTDENIPELPPRLRRIYYSYHEPAIKADLLRMYVVHIYGGIYMDADFVMIDGFHSDKMLNLDFEGFITYNHSYGTEALGNGIFGFTKGHPLLKHMLDNVTHEGQWVGPNWWAQVMCRHFGLGEPKGVTLKQLETALSTQGMKVIDWKDFSQKCFRHLDMATWIKGSEWNKKLESGNYD